MNRPQRLAFLLALLTGVGLLASSARAGEGTAREKAAAKPAAKPAPATPRVPMLWEVDTSPKIYLFGTIHVADPRVLDHPPVVKKALEASQALYTEIELEAGSMAAMQQRVVLPPGQSLSQLLPKDLYERTDKLFSAKGMPLKALERIKVWGVWMVLQTLDAPKAAAGAQALDASLYANAKAEGKTVGGLEKPEEQIDIFDHLSVDEQIRLLATAVDSIEEAREAGVSPIEELTKLYLSGDADGLLASLFESQEDEDPLMKRLMKKLLDERNVRMVRRMLAKAQSQPEKTMFVAVGTGHYPGTKGILTLLESTGYRTRRLTRLVDLQKPWPRTLPKKAPVRTRRRIKVGPFCLPGPCCPKPDCPKSASPKSAFPKSAFPKSVR